MPEYLGTADKVVIKNYKEIYSSATISSNTITFDLSQSSIFNVDLTSNIFTIIIINLPPSTQSFNFTIIFTADGTSRAIRWPESVLWPDGIAPAITGTNNKKDVLNFSTTDGGNTWYGFVGGQDI
jgi:hypothetical protein